ncbi:hypothetical protein MNBD_GAMMA12-839 [hydrothermal vent metagenome]|uniref:DUF7079 domain-containing protein n=1 Tax=hydrothermal vent metagenome TaxID=652676 RepID=A0A3B0ZH98_9ZZZZ
MKSPENDIADRIEVWESLQMVWMDVDFEYEVELIARFCANTKYSIVELKEIYWNEVMPAVSPNLQQLIPEWTGYNSEYLRVQVLKNHTFGRSIPDLTRKSSYSVTSWRLLEVRVLTIRANNLTDCEIIIL